MCHLQPPQTDDSDTLAVHNRDRDSDSDSDSDSDRDSDRDRDRDSDRQTDRRTDRPTDRVPSLESLLPPEEKEDERSRPCKKRGMREGLCELW